MVKVILALILGIVVGGIGALAVGGGMMAGAGAGVGLASGICMTVEAARDLDLLSEAQVDQVLAHATEKLSATGELPEGTAPHGSAAQCAEVMKNLRAQ